MAVGLWVCGVALAQELPGAVLLSADRLELPVDRIVQSPDGTHVLLLGQERAVRLGPQGDPVATVEISRAQVGDVSASGRFALVHEGGITIHSDSGREIGRLTAFGTVEDVALSPDGRHLALATSLSLLVYDAVDGRTLWSSDGVASDVAYDAAGVLYGTRAGGKVSRYQATSGKALGEATVPATPGFLADGCLHQASGPFCPMGDSSIGVRRPDGSLWLLADGRFDRFRPLSDADVAPIGPDGGSGVVTLAWAGSEHLLLARMDGHVERRSREGATLADVLVPDCQPCSLVGLGADAAGNAWAVAGSGAWGAWDAAGKPVGKKFKPAPGLVSVARLPDGTWVSLAGDGRARLGAKPGAGAALPRVDGAVGVDAAGGTVAVWSGSGLELFDVDGKLRATPDLGANRRPVVVRVSPDGGAVAVLDDDGALHSYRTSDGRAVFRSTAKIQGSLLAWAPGSTQLVAGGDPLRTFRASDGAEVLRLELAPDGRVDALAFAPDGTLAVVHTGEQGQLVRSVAWSVLSR